MTQETNPNAGIRLKSMFLDHIFMTMIAMVFFIPMMIEGFSEAFSVSHEQDLNDGFSGPLLYIGLVGFSLYFCKDCIGGQSIAKRMLKLRVINNSTGQPASSLRCFTRNVFCLIWPVEVIAVLINPGRRIGDQVAGTRVIYFDPSTMEQPKFDLKSLLVPLALSFGFLLLILQPFRSLNSSMTRVNYIESSYNDKESKALEKAYADSLGRYLTASVKVYDKIEDQHVKYISIIYRLKENYLENPTDADDLRVLTLYQLYHIFPKNTFTGQAQYVYQSGGSMQSSSIPIGIQIKRSAN